MGNMNAIFIKDEINKNLITLYPKKKIKRSIGSFHPKIMFLKFKDRLRIVIGSGNLATGDWIFWINSFIIMDFQEKSKYNSKNKLRIKKSKKKN